MSVQRYPCASCGAQLEFTPGTSHLTCPHCGHTQEIPSSAEDIQELDFHAFLELARLDTKVETEVVLHCEQCAAEFTIGPYKQTDSCPFCGHNVVVPANPETRIEPASLVPFQLDARAARDKYAGWISSRFWAPNDLKNLARAESTLHGVYCPYWTYDSVTSTWYQGQRGEHYYVTETYTENGQTRTRQVQRTRWYPASGMVVVPFDDVLVLGTTTLPRKYTELMQKWDLAPLTGYKPDYLTGFQAMRYDVDLPSGFDLAKGKMAPVIHSAICSDIGGDEQRVTSSETQYDQLTFKHILLPIFSGAYRYRDKTYRFFINGQSGQVAGEAPISWIKVTIAVILGLIIIGTIIYFVSQGKGDSSSTSAILGLRSS
jgi:DNA-directed RNA polymerase subunit RPC12/RpoP